MSVKFEDITENRIYLHLKYWEIIINVNTLELLFFSNRMACNTSNFCSSKHEVASTTAKLTKLQITEVSKDRIEGVSVANNNLKWLTKFSFAK